MESAYESGLARNENHMSRLDDEGELPILSTSDDKTATAK